MIEDMVEQVVTDDVTTLEEEPAIRSTDPKWVDHVLEQLADHELVKGAPTTDGLRRVTELVFGEILESNTDILEIPKTSLNGRTTAKHTLVITKYSNGTKIIVSACVDVVGEKLPHPFNQHIVSTACTRAEGKALRRALKIRIQTAEELANVDDVDGDANLPINDQQIVAINVLCKRNNVDVVKFVKANSAQAKKSIKEASNVEGGLMINKLSLYQREGAPKTVEGYKSDWQVKFGE